ncbi:hypothetical protein [Endozoicomonas sp.]|uniref:hypothetical protein n=1 Tax=Endozoicomonas sp. TaxID=1892382 RepID=UPI00383B2BFB
MAARDTALALQCDTDTPAVKAPPLRPSFSSHLPSAENQHQPPGTTGNDRAACRKPYVPGSQTAQRTKSQPKWKEKFSHMADAVRYVHWLENQGDYIRANLYKSSINPIAFQKNWRSKCAIKHAVELNEQGNTTEALKYLDYIIERDSSNIGQNCFPLGFYFDAVRKKSVILKRNCRFEDSISCLSN